jgi:hypothetical protein
MSRDPAPAKGRRKSARRRLACELRLWRPFLGFLFCYSLSAAAILVSEWTTTAADEAERASRRPNVAAGPHFTISMSSTSNASAAPGRIRGGAPRLP